MDSRDVKLWLRYSSVGLELAVAVAVLTAGGYWLDMRMGMLPLFTMLGAILGMIVGFYQVFRSLGSGSEDDHSGKNKNGTEKDT